jgi:hypothetical protein
MAAEKIIRCACLCALIIDGMFRHASHLTPAAAGVCLAASTPALAAALAGARR